MRNWAQRRIEQPSTRQQAMPQAHPFQLAPHAPQKAASCLLQQLLYAINTQDLATLAQFGIHDGVWAEMQEELQSIGEAYHCTPQLALAPQAPAFALFEMNPVKGQACWGMEAPLWVEGQHSDWTLRAELCSSPAGWVLLYRLMEVM